MVPVCPTKAEAEAWAAEWYRQYKPRPFDPRLYLTVGGLLEQLAPGEDDSPPPVRLLRLSWLQAWARMVKDTPGGLPLPRRQELEREHPEAFLTEEEVGALPRGSDQIDADRPLRLVAISHGWLTPIHPDPHGEQLVRFVDQVRRERQLCPGGPVDTCLACGTWLCPLADASIREQTRAERGLAAFYLVCCPLAIGCSQGCACGCVPLAGQGFGRSWRAFPDGEVAVFYDFASLMQKDKRGERTAIERETFSAALDKVGSWYAHRLTTTFSMSTLPEGWDATPYADRGWPTFERAVSGLIKPSDALSWRRVADPAVVRNADNNPGAYREPPLHPREFAAQLARRVFSEGESDCMLVASLYAETLIGALGGMKHLEFQFCGWGNEELEKLAEVLIFAETAVTLNLLSNPKIGARGLGALAAILAAGAASNLRKLIYEYAHESKGNLLRAACEGRGIQILTSVSCHGYEGGG